MRRYVFSSNWILFATAFSLFPGVICSRTILADTIWPGRKWAKASPESQGMSIEKLDSAANYALQAGGGSGCVIRGGYLVAEWGDPKKRADIKSCTKGSLGATALGLALDRNLLDWDDQANQYYPALGTGIKANTETDWLNEVTIRQLATMTAGFDDGRPPKLVYRPGTSGIYSNDTSNMLAELLTLRFNEDLYAFMKREIMDPIGAPASDWRWRKNSYRKDTVQGIKSREFASGLTITHRALARIGYLYLRQGRWNGQQLIKPETIQKLIEPTALPAPWDYYAVYWGSNQHGSFPEIPNDTYWAMGLGDSILIVCPSLDIVCVRLGTGSRRSMLPGSPNDKAWDEWGVRVAKYFKMVVEAIDTPYPPSPIITDVTWAPKSEILRLAKGSDNWPLTWADDGHLYAAYGDGHGFKPFVPKKLSMGFTRVSGHPPNIRGENIRSESGEQYGDGAKGKKASGILMLDGTLYMWARNAENSQLAWSKDRAQTWTWSNWTFKESFGCPTFLNFGKNYDGARDDFVYIYSQDSDSAYQAANRMVMSRVRKSSITERKAYSFFTELNPQGKPVWTKDITERGAVFNHFERCYRSGITYNRGLQRYLWCQTLPGDSPRFAGGFGIYDAPEPWGPWTTVFFAEKWDVGPGETSSLPTKWMSPDGRSAHLVFSGDDYFSVRKAEFTTSRKTRISIEKDRWFINGRITYPNTPAEGLLMNLRAVNSSFEDRNKPEFDSNENTTRFLQALPDYVAHGVRAFTLNLQGGMPGYEGAHNSAFIPDGTLRPTYSQRIERVIDACDRRGGAVILGCYYQRQDQILRDAEAVRNGVVNAVKWIEARGFTNVVLEISNEFNHGGFDHAILKRAEGQVELIELARRTVPGLLVSTSGLGNGRMPDAIAETADFILPHYNGTKLADIPKRIQALKRFGKPIICNEDDKVGPDGARAAELSVKNGASWGYMNKHVNQYQPFQFDGCRDDFAVYSTLQRLTSADTMVFPGKKWREVTPEAQGIDAARLSQAVEFLKDNSGKDGITELMIVRNGYLIWKGSNVDKVHGVWSLTKSFTSTALGLLIDDGKATLDTKARDILPEMGDNYPDLTLRHFTTMTSGYRAKGDEPRGSYLHGPSQTPFVPGPPLFTPPGSEYAYWDSAMNQFGNVLTRIAAEPLASLFERRIADPIDMDPEKWRWGRFGKINDIYVNGGSGNSSKHMFISARELARFGHLFLNRGRWNGQQLISQAWVDTTHSVHVPVTVPLGHPASGIEGRGVYGFNWWTNGIKPDGQRKWPGAPLGTYAASGYNNNDMFIIPEWNMVVVRLGLDQQDRPITDKTYGEFLRRIGKSINPTL